MNFGATRTSSLITGTQKVAASGQRGTKHEPSVIFSQKDKRREQEVSREMEISTHGFMGKSPPKVAMHFPRLTRHLWE